MLWIYTRYVVPQLTGTGMLLRLLWHLPVVTAAAMLRLLLLHAAVDALYLCWYGCCCCCCSCCSVLLLYYQKNAEELLLRTGGAHRNISCVAPLWTARFLCTCTHHGWLCCTGRIFDSITFISEGKSCRYTYFYAQESNSLLYLLPA